MKNAWPVKAQALGGRHYRGDYVDQNFDTYSVEYTFRRRNQVHHGRPLHGRLRRTSTTASPTAPRARRSSPSSGDCGAPSATFKGLGSTPAEHALGIQGQAGRAESLPERMERPGRRHPQRQALQRSETGRRGQPGDLDGPHGRAHRPDHHLRPDAQLRPRVRAGPRQAHHGLARPAACRRRRRYPVPQPGIVTNREYA